MTETEKKFNINELLERKKEIEQQIESEVAPEAKELQFIEQTITDYTNPKNNKKITTREKVDLNAFGNKFNGMVDELAKIKTAIQRYNAENVLGKLNDRDAVRKKIEFLTNIKSALIKEKQYQKKVTREGKDGETLESTEIVMEPMFSRDDVEKQLNQLCAQERKINTEIQKLNLNANVKI